MKRKLTVNSIAGKNLVKRKGQYALLIFGIVLAMVFSSSVLFFLSCMQTSLDVSSKNLTGAQDAIYFDADDAVMKKAADNGVIDEYGFAHVIGMGYSEESGENHAYSIAFLDEKAKELSYQSFIEGNYPTAENEIAIEKSTLARLAPDARIGDEITLTFRSQNGTALMDQTEEKTYRLVGIAKNKKANLEFNMEMLEISQFLPSVFVSENSRTALGGKEMLISYLTEAEPQQKDMNLYVYCDDESNGLAEDHLLYCTETSYFLNNISSIITENLTFIIIFSVILLVASCMGIVNAFSSNLNDRKKQIGMFRTVGATKRQIIYIFGREAFIISLVSAPVSVLVSYFAVFGISKMLGENFTFVPNWKVLVLCSVFGICCVMTAALIPLSKASKISPVQAIRNIEYTRSMKNKKIKTQKSFRTSVLLAKRSASFHKTRQITVCAILVITIVFSCYGFSFADSLIKEGNPYYLAYDYVVFPNGASYSGVYHYANQYVNFENLENGFTDRDLQNVLKLSYVQSAHGAQKANAFVLFDSKTDYFFANYSRSANDVNMDFKIDENNIDEYLNQVYDYTLGEIKEKYGYAKELLPSGIEAYSPHLFERLQDSVIDGKINIDKINSGEEIILVAPEKTAYKYEKDKYGYERISDYTDDRINDNIKYYKIAERNIKAGDRITVSTLSNENAATADFPADCVRTDKEVTVGAVLSKLPEHFQGDEIMLGIWDNIKVITSINAMKYFSPYEEYCNLNINLKENSDEKVYLEMQDFLEDLSADINYAEIRSFYNYIQESKQFNTSVLLSVAAIVILLISVAASMINNTMSAQIRNGKRVIGTLRAVGATQELLAKIYVRQLMTIFLWSFGIGFGSYIISFIILYIRMHNERPWLVFSIWQTVLACIILFSVCSLNMWFKIRKETKNSIIDNIREL